MLYKISIIFGLLLILVVSLEAVDPNRKLNPKNDTKFMDFIDDFDISLRNKTVQLKAYKNFLKTSKKIEEHNSDPNKKYSSSLNEFSILSPREIKKTLFGYIPPDSSNSTGERIKRKVYYSVNKGSFYETIKVDVKFTSYIPTPGYIPPISLDWTEKGFKTPVRHQKRCGSCWAFAAAGALEAAIFKSESKSIILSPQRMVDCDYEDHGCDGGNSIKASNFIARFGLVPDENYPYIGKQKTCEKKEGSKYGISEVVAGEFTTNLGLMELLDKFGPMMVTINAEENTGFMNYDSGIFAHPSRPIMCDPNKSNHAVLLVGYGEEPNGDKWWKIKNSWGTSWGEGGYGKLSRDSENTCGIAGRARAFIYDKNAVFETENITNFIATETIEDPNCNGIAKAYPGCKTAYTCTYPEKTLACSLGMFSSTEDLKCGPNYECKKEWVYGGCPKEGMYLTEKCKTIKICGAKYIRNLTVPSGYLFDDIALKYRKSDSWKCPI